MGTLCAAAVLIAVSASSVLAESPPATQPAVTTIVVHVDQPLGPISPWIYGSNQPASDPASRYTLVRQGGNRMTAYNWENNASNAGNDWHFQNDGYLGESDTPGEAVRVPAAKAIAAGQKFVATVPMVDFVSADKRADGDVTKSGADYLTTRFRHNLPTRNTRPNPAAAASTTTKPDATDDAVYQDEFVRWLESTFPKKQRAGDAAIWYALDNEPDLWSSTHKEVHPEPLTYAELIDRTGRYAAAIKAASPDALVFGFVSYGWGGFTTLQNAPDRAGRDVVDVYLDAMKKAEAGSGRRLVDVLDLHWYPEARGGGDEQTGVRISEPGPRANEPAVNDARMQATRSLWDSTYREMSWIGRTLGDPIRLIPRLRAKIDAHYPGTKLAFTEYNYGGGDNISGAIAEADALGIFGREGVFAAAFWSLSDKEAFSRAAFDAYRNYDGNGRTFGETALRLENGDTAMIGAYASRRAADGARVIVLTNRTANARPIRIDVDGAGIAKLIRWQMTAAKPAMTPAGDVSIELNAATLTLPAQSVTTIEMK